MSEQEISLDCQWGARLVIEKDAVQEMLNSLYCDIGGAPYIEAIGGLKVDLNVFKEEPELCAHDGSGDGVLRLPFSKILHETLGSLDSFPEGSPAQIEERAEVRATMAKMLRNIAVMAEQAAASVEGAP